MCVYAMRGSERRNGNERERERENGFFARNDIVYSVYKWKCRTFEFGIELFHNRGCANCAMSYFKVANQKNRVNFFQM